MVSRVAASLASLEEIGASSDLCASVGSVCAGHLKARAQAAREALETGSCDYFITAVKDLVQDCLTLPDWVHEDFDNEAWTFGPAVAEAIAVTVAVVAGLSDPDLCPGWRNVSKEQHFDILEDLGRELDHLAQYIFGFLSRYEASSPGLDDSAERIRFALRRVCAWALAALGRAVGYNQFSANLLWDWCAFDHLWVMLLTKGALTLENQQQSTCNVNLVETPPDLQELQQAVAGVALELVHPNIAFAKDVVLEHPDSDAVSIVTRSMQLVNHRAQLASAALESQLFGPLVQTVHGMPPHDKAKLVTFLLGLLQTDLFEDPPWAHAAVSAPFILEYARSVTVAIQRLLHEHSQDIWVVLSSVPGSGRLPRGFMRECCDFAFATSNTNGPAAGCVVLICAIIGQNELATISPSLVAALCVLASNAQVPPSFDGADGGLAHMLGQLTENQRHAILEILTNWKGLVRKTELVAWFPVIGPQPIVPSVCPGTYSVQPAPPNPGNDPIMPAGGLRELLQSAPLGLRCAIDGRLVTDPVRSPHGHIFERSVLAQRLALLPGQCPASGLPLQLEECTRDADVRLKAAQWFREQRGIMRSQPGRRKQTGIASNSMASSTDAHDSEYDPCIALYE